METIEIIFGLLVLFVIIYYFYFKNGNSFKTINKKGMYVLVDNKKYPNLMIFLTEADDKITVGIFDKNFTDYIGNPTREELQKQLDDPNVYEFDHMTKQEFVSKFGKDLGDDNVDPLKLYYKYKGFGINQMYGYDMDISKNEFIRKYGEDIKDMGESVDDVYDKFKIMAEENKAKLSSA